MKSCTLQTLGHTLGHTIILYTGQHQSGDIYTIFHAHEHPLSMHMHIQFQFHHFTRSTSPRFPCRCSIHSLKKFVTICVNLQIYITYNGRCHVLKVYSDSAVFLRLCDILLHNQNFSKGKSKLYHYRSIIARTNPCSSVSQASSKNAFLTNSVTSYRAKKEWQKSTTEMNKLDGFKSKLMYEH